MEDVSLQYRRCFFMFFRRVKAIAKQARSAMCLALQRPCLLCDCLHSPESLHSPEKAILMGIGWILARFFLHIYSPRSSQGKLKHKKERGHYIHLDQTNLVNKGFIALTKRQLFLAGRGKSRAGKMAPLIHLLEFVLLYVCLCSAV